MTQSTINCHIQHVFRQSQRGIPGLTEQLLTAQLSETVVYERIDDKCVCVWHDQERTGMTPIPLAPAAFRTILAQVAKLCIQQSAGSISPYDGEGILIFGDAKVIVKYTNTIETQRLMVTGDSSHAMAVSSSKYSSETTVQETHAS